MADITSRLPSLRSKAEKILALSGSAGASVGILHKGNVILTENFGFRDHELQNPPNADTLYNIGSLSKSMLAQAASFVVDEGLLSWNTPVSSIVPEFQSSDKTMTENCTLIDLLSHRSGLPTANVLWYQGGSKPLVTKQCLLPMINAMSSTFSFRSSWGYTNWGYALAGEMLERVTGGPWQDILKKLWKPLGMQRTTTDAEWKKFPNVAEGFMALEDASLLPFDAQIIDDSTVVGAAGAVCSSVNELLLYYTALMKAYNNPNDNATDSNPESAFRQVSTVFSPHAVLPYPAIPAYGDTTYALGWVRATLPGAMGLLSDNTGLVENMPIIGRDTSPQQVFYHQGTTAGFYSSCYILPETESCVIVLVNTKPRCDSSDWIAQLYLEALLGSSETTNFIELTEECIQADRRRFLKAEQTLNKDRVMGTVSKPLEQYCGRYHWATKQFFIDIALEGENLLLIFQDRADQRYNLRHFHYDAFTWLMTNEDEARRGRFVQSAYTYKIVFQCDEHQTVEGLTWKEIGGGSAFFSKQKPTTV